MNSRNKLEEFLTEVICDDADDVIDFLNVRDNLRRDTADKLKNMSEEKLIETFHQYPAGYESIGEVLEES